MSAYIPLIVLGGASLVMRKIYKSWFAPGAFFPLAWFFFILIPMIFAPEFPFYFFGLWVITAMAIAFAAGSLLGYNEEENLENKKSEMVKPISGYKSIISYSTLTMTGLSFLGVILLLRFSMEKFQMNFSLFSLFILPSNITAERYNELLVYPVYLKFFLYFLFPASLIAGIGYSLTNKKLHFLYLSPLFVSILKGTLETTRSTILLSVILWLAGFAGGRVITRDHLHRLMEKKLLIFLTLAGIAFTFLFIGLQWIREAGGDIIFLVMIKRIKLYFFGYLSAFTIWVKNIREPGLTLGLTTFAGPFNILGLIDRELGFYSHTFVYNGSYTNVYTALRGLIHDFSIMGSLLVCMVAGFLSTISYYKSLRGFVFWLIPLTMFYSFTLYSPLISVFHYNSIIMAWVIVFAIFFIKPRLRL
ncbi:MAG: O-antigen polymerase [Fidelibacterota bacterium]